MILVTGGTGLVGSHLLYKLTQENKKIRALYRTQEKLEVVKKVFSYYENDSSESFHKIDWIQADITDTPSLEPVFKNITEVYHVAALVSFNPKDYKKMRQVNIYGTANIVNFSIATKVKKFCFVSSIAAVGGSVKGKLVTEENEWNDNADHHGYAITKYGAEMEVWRGSQEGLEVVIVNPGVILGSGFWQEGSGKLFTQIHNGFKFYTEGITGFVGVQDVVNSMVQLMSSEIRNERFILVSENKSFKEILFLIADAFNKKRPSIKTSKFITELFWRVDWLLTKVSGKKPLLTKNSARSSHNQEQYSSKKISTLLNFEFQKIEDVIRIVCENYLK